MGRAAFQQKVVVITGGCAGIGRALALRFAQAGAHLAILDIHDESLVAFRQQLHDKLNADVLAINCDVSDDQACAEAMAQVVEHFGGIDLLINNAGLLQDEQLGSIDFDSIRTQMEINAYAPLRVAEALVPFMGPGSKIANITSRMGSIADNDSGGRYGYRASKAALNAFGKSLAVDLKPKGIAVAQLHPGYVKTRMVNFGGLITPEESARGLAERIANLTLENTGSFWHSNGEELPW